MCFSPLISLITFLIEFIVATIILFKFKIIKENVFWIILIYLLGLSLVIGIIVIEALAISYFSPFVSTLIRNVSKIYEIEL